MTDARFPERWLNDRRVQQLSPEAHFAFSNALMWSVSNRTDGVIKFADLELIPRCKSAHADELAESGLWKRRPDGWSITVYKATQRSRKQLESDDEYRERERERMATKRAADQRNTPNRRDVRRDVRANERTDNIGQDRASFATRTNNVSRDDEKNDDYFTDCEAPLTDADGFPLDTGMHP
jgi:hypothetical protein